jgi:hypothetical protein
MLGWRVTIRDGELGVTAHPLFSLKGWNQSAQGNALGLKRPTDASPERA